MRGPSHYRFTFKRLFVLFLPLPLSVSVSLLGIHWKDVKKIESKGVEEKQMLLWLENILSW